MKDAALRLLEQDARFRAAVRKGIEQAERGEFIEEEEMGARIQADASTLIRIRWTPAAEDLKKICE